MTPRATPDAVAQLIVMTVKHALAPLRASLDRLEDRLSTTLSRLDAVYTTLPVLRERLAVVETRAPVPGPPGQDGAPGEDGRDGVGFDDLSVEFDGDRTITLSFTRDTVTKAFPITLPIPRYQGTWSGAQTYAVGDLVTWDGSTWHCQLPTSSRPGENATAWRMMVKRGRDGRDRSDGATH